MTYQQFTIQGGTYTLRWNPGRVAVALVTTNEDPNKQYNTFYMNYPPLQSQWLIGRLHNCGHCS